MISRGTGISRSSATALFMPGWAKLVAPPTLMPQDVIGGQALNLTPRGVRCIVPEDGTLVALMAFIVASSGNVSAAVYDTGEALAGSRTKLVDTGSVVCGAANTWQEFAGLSVPVRAGQELDLAVTADNATTTVGRITTSSAGAATTIPAGWMTAPGGAAHKPTFSLPVIGALNAWAATVTEANVAASTLGALVFGRLA